MALLGAYEKPVRVEVTILEKIAPGSGIGSSAASSAAAVWGVNELLGRPFSGERLVEFAMMGEALIGGTSHADNVGPAVLGGVVLGSATGKERFTDAAALLDYGFSNYMIYTPGLPEEALQPVPVVNGMQSQVAVESAASGSVLLTKGREKDLKTEVKLSESVEAPVAKGQQLGKIVYTLDGEVLTEYPITAAGDVEQISFFSALGILARELLRL